MSNIDNYPIIEQAYQEHRDALLRYVVSRLGNTDTAEDIVQDTFVRILNMQQMVQATTVRALMLSIAHNIIIDHKRKSLIRERFSRSDISWQMPENTNAMAEYNELAECEMRVVSQMPPKRKEVYLLRQREGLSIKEVAARMNISPKTAETHWGKGIHNVRQYLKEVCNY